MKKKIESQSDEWEVTETFESRSCTLDFSVVAVRRGTEHVIALCGSVNGKMRRLLLKDTLSDTPFEPVSRRTGIAIDASTLLQFALLKPETSILGEASAQLLDEIEFYATKITPKENELRHNVKEGHLSNRKALEDKKAEFIEESVSLFKENLQYRLLYTGKKQIGNFFIRLPETYETLREFLKNGVIPQIKSAKKSSVNQVRNGWKEMVRSISPPNTGWRDTQFPDDLLMRLDDVSNWRDELTAKMETHRGQSTPSDLALEWACRVTSFQGYEPHSLSIRELRKILKREREKERNRGTNEK